MILYSIILLDFIKYINLDHFYFSAYAVILPVTVFFLYPFHSVATSRSVVYAPS